MIVSILVAILGLSILIFVHELSHFLIAKASSIDAPVFSIGFGPKLFSFKWKGTDFRISAIPFGGYVQLKGMDPDEIKGEEGEFYSRNALLRIATIFGGPFANILLGFLVYLGILAVSGIEVPDTTIIGHSVQGSYLYTGDRIFEIDGKKISHWMDITDNLKEGSEVLLLRDGEEKVIIPDMVSLDSLVPQYLPVAGRVYKEGVAYSAGLREGAYILKIAGKEIADWEDIMGYIYPAIGETLDILYSQGSDTFQTTIVPEEAAMLSGDSIVKIGMIGIASPTKGIKIPFTEAISFASQQTLGTATLIFRSISLIIHRKVSARDLAGPVGIVMMTKKSMVGGIINLLAFFALLSINLAVVNLIPIPPLDGFHILVSAIGGIFRKKPTGKMLKIIEMVGFILIVSLMIMLLSNDILRIFRGGM